MKKKKQCLGSEVLTLVKYKPIKLPTLQLQDPFGDYDRDGVVNIFDCAPFDPTRDGKLWESVKKAAKTGAVMTGRAAKRGAIAVKERAGEELREYGERRRIEHKAYLGEMRRLSKERGEERAQSRRGSGESREKLFKVKFRDKITRNVSEEIMTKEELSDLKEDSYVIVLSVKRYTESKYDTRSYSSSSRRMGYEPMAFSYIGQSQGRPVRRSYYL